MGAGQIDVFGDCAWGMSRKPWRFAQTRLMSDERYTSQDYAERHPNWHREHSAWKAGQIFEMLRRNQLDPSSVAEVGCGAGGILVELQQRLPTSARFTGYDIAPAAMAMARPMANERLEFREADLLALETPPVDLLLTIDVAEHVQDYLGFLQALRPRARRHIIHLPLDLSLASCVKPARLQWAFESVGHLHYFTRETALQAVTNAGYRVDDWSLTCVELDLPPSDAQRQRLRFLRRWGRRISPAWTARLLGGFSVLILCSQTD